MEFGYQLLHYMTGRCSQCDLSWIPFLFDSKNSMMAFYKVVWTGHIALHVKDR